VRQDARKVNTKFSKTLQPTSFPLARAFGRSWPIASSTCAERSFGGMTIRFFPQRVGPIMHHPGAGPYGEGLVERRADCISGSMGPLQYDVLMRVALLMQQRPARPWKPWPVMRPYPMRLRANRIVFAHRLIGSR
jgi:hypothetical protein